MTTLPYIRPASQGTPQNYFNPNFQQRDSYKNPLDYQAAWESYKSPLDYQAAIEQARQQMVNGRQTFGNNMPFQIQNLRTGWTNNNNPELQGGIATANVNGQTVRVPNALLQQMMFTDSFNQGRSNEVANFLGANQQRPQGMNYSDMGASIQGMDRYLASNPQFTQEGALNPYRRTQDNAMNAYGEVNRLESIGRTQPMTEIRSVGGAMMGGNYQGHQNALMEARRKAQEAGNQFQAQDTRAARVGGSEQATSMLNSMQQNAPRIRSTYSNLPIKETLI
jgi:hypothetical protein